MQRPEDAKVQLGVRPGLPFVAVHHRRRLVAGSVGDPRLGLPGREVEGDERRSEIMRSEIDPGLAVLEELVTGDARSLQVSAQTVRGSEAADAVAESILEDVRR